MRDEKFHSSWIAPHIEHGVTTIYGWTVWHPEKFVLGHFTDIGWGCFIQAEFGVIIGSFTQIGGGTYIYSADTQRGVHGEITIGREVNIGAQSLILPGAVIPAGAKVPAYSIIKGEH